MRAFSVGVNVNWYLASNEGSAVSSDSVNMTMTSSFHFCDSIIVFSISSIKIQCFQGLLVIHTHNTRFQLTMPVCARLKKIFARLPRFYILGISITLIFLKLEITHLTNSGPCATMNATTTLSDALRVHAEYLLPVPAAGLKQMTVSKKELNSLHLEHNIVITIEGGYNVCELRNTLDSCVHTGNCTGEYGGLGLTEKEVRLLSNYLHLTLIC